MCLPKERSIDAHGRPVQIIFHVKEAFMEPRREKKNIILKIPRGQWVYRKVKQMNAKVKATVRRIKQR
jgi:crotonobetainyl-CoA:carnitine CoA-transferase CaiB-like acyl-CoA transferase